MGEGEVCADHIDETVIVVDQRPWLAAAWGEKRSAGVSVTVLPNRSPSIFDRSSRLGNEAICQ